MAKRIRGVMFEENLKNSMGLEFYNLSHRFGYQSPNWPYFEDVKIERIHYMAKSGVLSQRITTSMHNTTHIDAPAHVIQGTPFIDEVPLPHFFGSGIVVSIPKNKWEPITGDDLEKACGKIVRPRDVVIVNTGWHKFYEDSEDYFCRAPGFVPSAGEWFVKKKVKVVGHDTQANDHPLATAIGPQRNGPLHPHLAEEYKRMVGRPRLEGRLPGMGAGAPHSVQERHHGHRECRRRHRQGHRQARHLRLFPVELGSRRRLHRASGRHRRSEAANTASSAGGNSNARQTFRRRQGLRRAQSPRLHLAAPVRRRGRRHQGPRSSAIRTSCPAAAPVRTPRRRRRSISFCAAN